MNRVPVLIAPFSKRLRNGKQNAKNYPYWDELIGRLHNYCVITQIGSKDERQLVPDFRKDLPLTDITTLVEECRFWISVDSFLPHLAHHKQKPGVVLWGLSDPNIFGYPENLNLIKDRSLLRKDQFLFWEDEPYNVNAFMSAEQVFTLIRLRFLQEI